MRKLIFESDWLGSTPFFYNERTGRTGCSIHDVIDLAGFEWHPEGFNNYLDFGYSVFEQTPVRDVKFLSHSSQLLADPEGRLSVRRLEDPAERLAGKETDEGEVWELIRARIRSWEKSVEGEIVLPVSGGYDSRVLSVMVEEKSRIRAFTYGISNRQEQSFEVIYAQELARRLDYSWTQIPLGMFHRHLDDWDRIYGAFTHAHGMYHIEFYTEILNRVGPGRGLLSGFAGDWFSGAQEPVSLKHAGDLRTLGYTHDINADSKQSILEDTGQLRDAYWAAYADRLRCPIWQALHRARLKAGLISYLTHVPERLGFKPYPPFADLQVAMAMLNLPAEVRLGRAWQQRFFRRHGLDLESMSLPASARNTLDLQALALLPLPPLEVRLLREVVRPEYVDWINAQLRRSGPGWNRFWRCVPRGSLGKVLARVGVRDQRLAAYAAYMTLRPIENLIRRRDAIDASGGGGR
ncbi:MAG: hypothetical protein MUC91_14155 [Verrucomicrobia bacterium]|nr:hypothetical protein [Verrucomicrobiota bacterium]